MKHFSLSDRYLRRLLVAVQLVATTLLLIAGHVVRADSPPKFSTAGAPMDIIGNTVFQDYNRNGNQDTGEPGFANIPVRLFQSGIERGLVLTGSNGQFSFTNANVPVGIRPNTAYEIRIAAADFPAGFNLTRPGTATPGNNAQLIGNNAVVFLTTDASGNSPSTYGIGFAAGNPDLAITTSATSSTVAKGGTATFTIQVNNIGSGTATSVVVSTTLDPGLTYGSSSPTATTITTEGGSTVLRWSLNTLTAGAPQSTFSVIATADLEGVLYNTASVTTADTESNPTNNISRACVSVPIKLCPGDQYVASVSAEYTNVQWFRNGSSTPIASGNSLTIVQSGSYTFTTTANTSCPANGCCPVIVEDGILPNLAITPANPAICAGTSTSLTATGCTSASLVWSTGATSVSIPVSPTATSVYSVTCNSTTYGTCTVSASTTVTVNPSVTATLSSATICSGTSATLTATGGVSYRFGPGFTNATGTLVVSLTTIGTTPYSVTVTDANGCSATATGSVTVNPLPEPTIAGTTSICAGLPISLTASPTAGLIYAWSGPNNFTSTSNPLTIANSTSANSGTYEVLVTDANGCTAVASQNVTVKPVPQVEILNTSIVCSDNEPAVVISTQVTGGTPPVSYAWYLSGTAGVISTAPNPAFTATGTYSVVVTDASGCVSNTATVTIVEPDPLAVNIQTTNPLCFSALGAITVTINGGLAPYTVSYQSASGPTSPESTTSVSTLQAVAGSYSVVVTDANGCSLTQTATLTQPTALSLTLTNSGPVCASQTTGSITSSVAGGTPPYSYSWSNGATTPNLTALSGGSYSVVVTDANGCTITSSTTLPTNPLPPAPTLSLTQPTCVTLTGTITVQAPATGVEYSFDNGISYQVSSSRSGLSPDVYQVRVRNTATGCESLPTSATVNPIPTPPTVTIAGNTTVCEGQSVTLTASPSPAGSVTYAWSGPGSFTSVDNPLIIVSATPAQTGTYRVVITDVNECTAVASTNVTVNPLPIVTLSSATICAGQSATLTATGAGVGGSYVYSVAGGSANTLTVSPSVATVYSVTATTSAGCSGTATGTVTVNPSVTATLSSATICNGTIASLTATGGTSYTLNPGGLLSSTGSFTVSPSELTTYSLVVTDANGCSGTATGTVTVNPSVTATLSSATICDGTVASLTATGGTSYTLNPGGLLSSTGSFTVSPSELTTYSVVVTNAFGCSGSATGSVTVNPSVTATLSSATICDGTVASLTATGGTSYTLNPGGLLSSTGSFTVSPSELTTYSVVVTNAFGCSGSATGSVTVNPSVTATLSSATICDGTVASLTATGGTSYTLNPGGLLSSTGSFTVSPSELTTYSVVVTNAFGCSGSATGTVTVNPSVTATLSSATICDGTVASLTATGGTSYTLNPGGLLSSTGSFTVSPSELTTYSVVVTNAFGCSGSATGTVTVNPSVTATLSSATICDGTVASLTATGGTSYTLNPGGLLSSTGSFTVSPSELTTYSVVVTNAFGCSGTATGTVTVNPSVTATLSSATICDGTVASLTATGGTSYTLNPGGLLSSTGSFTVSPSELTTYSVVVTNAFGCSGTATGTVTVNPSVTATLSSATICDGTVASLTATGGTSYTLNPGGLLSSTGSFTVSPSELTTYSVVVTNAFGCSGTATGTVTVNPSVTATLSSATICDGTVASLTATGGTSYTLNPGGLLSSTGSFTVSPSELTTYSVVVTNAFGCSGSATGSVTVNPSVTATLSSATICDGTVASLTATGGTSYTLNPGGLLSSTGSFTVSPSELTTYSVVVTNAFGCSGTATGTVTVNPSVTATLSSATICDGTVASLTATGGTSYTLNPGGLLSSTGSFTVSPSELTTYSVVVTNAFGCSGSATGSVTVNPSVTATLSSATICDGTVASLTATGGTSYTLNPGGLLSSTGSFTVSPSELTTYSVVVTNAFGCSGSATGTVTVNPSVTATLSSATICDGTVASLTATGGTSYTLNPGGLLSSTGSFTVSPSELTTYSVVVTNAFGCSGSATGSVTVNPSVTATLTVSSATICQGTSATLTAGGGTVFLWSTGETTPAISVSVSATYSVTVSNADGCSDTISTTITVNPTPILTLNSPTVCAGQSTVLTVGGCSGVLTWSTGDQTTSLTVVPLITTSYSATCVLTTGCSSTVSTTVTVSDVPTYDAAVAGAATCTGATANDDASITLTNVAGAVRADISTGSTYGGPTPGTVVIGDGTVRFGGLRNPAAAQPYTIRLFAASGCFTDVTVILDPVICQCPAPVCVPIVIQKIMR